MKFFLYFLCAVIFGGWSVVIITTYHCFVWLYHFAGEYPELQAQLYKLAKEDDLIK